LATTWRLPGLSQERLSSSSTSRLPGRLVFVVLRPSCVRHITINNTQKDSLNNSLYSVHCWVINQMNKYPLTFYSWRILKILDNFNISMENWQV
jgi:hypothetical protein